MPASQAATPIVGGGSYGTAVNVAAEVAYSGVLTGTTHAKDFFFVDVSPGEAITVDVASTAVWSSGTLYFYLDDQAHTTYLTIKGISGPEQSDKVAWMGNSTTPTRYYFRVETGAGSGSFNYMFTLHRQRQYDGGAADDAGETLGTGRVISPVLGAPFVFTGTLNNKDTDDYFRINAASGQIISVTYSVSNYGTGGAATIYAYLYDAANTSYLKILTFGAPNAASQGISWMSNNTAPAGYGMRMQHGSGDGIALYQISVILTQQADGGAPGDAGDGFDEARMIDQNTVAPNNMLGQADDDDYYKIDLPDDNLDFTYNLIVSPPVWGTRTTGYLTIRKFSATRAPIGSPTYLTAPVVEPAFIDISGCDGCYVQIEDNTSGSEQILYALRVRKPLFVYIPLVRR